MSVLRTRVIRLASMLSEEAPLKGYLVAALRSTATESSATEKLGDLFKKHELKPEDLLDLMLFVQKTPLAGQPPKIVKNALKGWWGGALPARWDLPDKAVASLVETLVDALPEISVMAAKLTSKDTKKEPKKAGVLKTASGMVMMAVLAHHVAQKSSASKSAYEKHRRERIEKMSDEDLEYERVLGDWRPGDEDIKSKEKNEDYDYDRPVNSTWTDKRYSQEQDKVIEFTGTQAKRTQWDEDLAYSDYTWAKKMTGGTPLEQKKWAKDRWGPGMGRASTLPADEAIKELHAHNDASMASHVRKALKEHGEDADIKSLVAKSLDDLNEKEGKLYHAAREKHLREEFNGEDSRRLIELINKEEDSAGLFEKMVAVVAPEWARGKAKSRAEPKAEKEKAEHTAPRSYADYVKSKKDSGMGTPMSKEEWESRYK